MVIFFYIFAGLIVLSSLLVISSRNPVHSVLWLIFAFCNASGLMVLMGAEFLAMMLIVIYVGAVAVLFLFVVMMLDIKPSEFKVGTKSDLLIATLISVLLLVDLVVIILLSTKTIAILPGNTEFTLTPEISSIKAIGNLLYTEFVLPFQSVGIILFVAMIASISLVHRHRHGVKRQDVSKQLRRNKENSLSIAGMDGKNGLNNLDYED